MDRWEEFRLKELFGFAFPDSDNRIIVSWDEVKIEQFLKIHDLENVKIRFCPYRKTMEGFLKFLLSRITKKIHAKAGYYESPYTVCVFFDVAIYALRYKLDKSLVDFLDDVKMVLPRKLAYILGHELGHAKGDHFLEAPLWKFLILGKRHFRQITTSMEEAAKEFAERNIDELTPLFHVEVE